jgi:hypothetical protein
MQRADESIALRDRRSVVDRSSVPIGGTVLDTEIDGEPSPCPRARTRAEWWASPVLAARRYSRV